MTKDAIAALVHHPGQVQMVKAEIALDRSGKTGHLVDSTDQVTGAS